MENKTFQLVQALNVMRVLPCESHSPECALEAIFDSNLLDLLLTANKLMQFYDFPC